MSTIRIALSGAVYGLAILASPAAANERHRVRTLTRDLPTAGIGRIELRMPPGSLQIEPAADDRLRVELGVYCNFDDDRCAERARGMMVESTRKGDRLDVRLTGAFALRSHVRGRILVPRGPGLEVSLPAGKLTIRGVRGDLEVDVESRQIHRLEGSDAGPSGAEACPHDPIDILQGANAPLDQPIRLAHERVLQAVRDEALDLIRINPELAAESVTKLARRKHNADNDLDKATEGTKDLIAFLGTLGVMAGVGWWAGSLRAKINERAVRFDACDLALDDHVGLDFAPLEADRLDQAADLERALLAPEELVVGDVDRAVALLLETVQDPGGVGADPFAR